MAHPAPGTPGADHKLRGAPRHPGGTFMNPALQGLLTIVIGVGGCIGYFFLSNQILDKVIFPPSGPNAGRDSLSPKPPLFYPYTILASDILQVGQV